MHLADTLAPLKYAEHAWLYSPSLASAELDLGRICDHVRTN
jgi:hypothetical protein